MKKAIFLAICLLIFSNPTEALELEKIAFTPEWLKLLHYHQQSSQKYQGIVVNQDFYVSPEGRNNPKEEIEAEIASFSSGNKKCAFPARFEFLRQKNLVEGNLDDCDDYQKFISDIQPQGITIIFTNAYMSNPASLFGHTLIRIDTKRKGTQMLAHGVNFGANSGTEYGFLFALKGLTGFYNGIYAIRPYWDVINMYNNIENRDIWEYELNLSPVEIKNFVNHIYEMQKAEIPYYFLNKNCSYMLLELLEAVRPELKLSEQFQYTAIPLDTLKAINNIEGLVGNINYRPARYTKIINILKNMDRAQYNAFLDIIKNGEFDIDNFTPEQQSHILDAAYQYFQYQYFNKDMELSEYRKNSFATLRRRSQLPTVDELKIVGEDPVKSHNSAQISLKYGAFRQQTYEEIGIRPAYTALTDNSYGLIKGAEISVLSSSWRYYNQKHNFVLQDFTPLKIKSLVPSDRVFQPISYTVNTKITREYNPKSSRDTYALHLDAGVGQSYDLFAGIMGYGLFSLSGAYSASLPNKHWLGVRPEIGFYKDFGLLRANYQISRTIATGRLGDTWQQKAEISLDIATETTLNIEYNITDYSHYKKINEEFSLGLKYNL